MVFHQYTFQVHFVEIGQADFYMFDGDARLQIPGKPAGDLPGQPVLSHPGLQETPEQDDEQQQAEQNAQGYFECFPQGESVCVKVANRRMGTKDRPGGRNEIFVNRYRRLRRWIADYADGSQISQMEGG